MFAHLKILVLALGSLALATPLASADGFGITFAKQGKHTSFGFEFTSGGSFEPAPAPHAVACPPSVWVPAHYETVLQKVWVEGGQQKVWCAPMFEWRLDACGRARQVLVTPGHWNIVCTAGHYETRRVRVWQPAQWHDTGAHFH